MHKTQTYVIQCGCCDVVDEIPGEPKTDDVYDKADARRVLFLLGWDIEQEDCPRCAAQKGGFVVADDAYCRVWVSGQFVNSQHECVVNVFSLVKMDAPKAKVRMITMRASDVPRLVGERKRR